MSDAFDPEAHRAAQDEFLRLEALRLEAEAAKFTERVKGVSDLRSSKELQSVIEQFKALSADDELRQYVPLYNSINTVLDTMKNFVTQVDRTIPKN